MAESVVAFLLSQLSTLFQEECAHLGGLQRELQYIKDELGSMRAFLREAEAKEDADPNPHSEFQEWVEQVREAAYDTEDVLDEFLLWFPRHQAGGFYGRVQKIYTSLKTLRARHRVATKVKGIKYRIESISARHQRYKSENCSRGGSKTAVGENAHHDIRGHALLFDEADLVGIDKPKCELISHILDDNSHLKVISVVGMGGLGKTTLVKRVYEDGTVRRKFSSHAWLTVSQRHHIKELFKNLVRQLYDELQEQVPTNVESMDANELRAFAIYFLKQRKFLIVLDDVWGRDSWDAVKYALPDQNCGSRVVLTTRIADVASTSCKEPRGHVYKMKPLSKEESWTLFCMKAFEENRCPSFLEDVSRSLLDKCDGLPLAIAAISGLLALKDKSNRYEWEMVHRCLGVELEGKGKLDRVKKILLLSYNDLPYYLKICLLHISIYPEDYRIRVWRLIRLWVAEGFIQERKGLTIVEVGESYLNELVNRNLIQLGRVGDHLREYCSIHDLLREIIVSKSKEHNFTTLTIGRHTKWLANARRLAIHDSVDNIQEGFECKKLRSLVTFGCTNDISSSTISKLLWSGPKLLKVLNVEDAGLKNIPKEVFKLFLLKHLNLRGNPIEVIPRSIGKLKNLEFLNLDNTNVKELPVDILKLGKLSEVLCKKFDYSTTSTVSGFKAPYEIGQLLSLHSLDSIDADNKNVLREIMKLTKSGG